MLRIRSEHSVSLFDGSAVLPILIQVICSLIKLQGVRYCIGHSEVLCVSLSIKRKRLPIHEEANCR